MNDILVVVDLQPMFIRGMIWKYTNAFIDEYLERCRGIIERAADAGVPVIDINYRYRNDTDHRVIGSYVRSFNNVYHVVKQQDSGAHEVVDTLVNTPHALSIGDDRKIYIIGMNRCACVSKTARDLHHILELKPVLVDDGIECCDFDFHHWGVLGLDYIPDSYIDNTGPLDTTKVDLIQSTDESAPEWMTP